MIFGMIASEAVKLVSNIMSWVLIATIILGAIFVLVITIMIAKKIKYNRQMKHNQKEIEKYLGENTQNQKF